MNVIPVLGVKPTRGYYVFWQFYEVVGGPGTSIENSRRGNLNYMAKHILNKNTQNICPPPYINTFISHTKLV